MPSSRIPSPARSQGVISTPRKHTPRRSRSVCSGKSNKSLRLTAVIADSFKLSPMPNRQSVLNDDTYIEVPGRKSWWKKLGENSRDVMEVLENKDIGEVNNVAEEFDVEILSQEKKNYTIDLPESSDGESINSIVIPQRKLFTQKDHQVQKKFGDLIDKRETLAKLQKSHFDQEKDINVGPKNLFNQASKPRTKPTFPAALLNISSKAANKTKEMPTAEVKGQVRNLFGNRPGTKRKNMFADFIVSDSEEEIPDIQPKVFGFQKNIAQKRRESSASRGAGHSPTSSIDLELDEWKLLPSSTMVENQLEEATTPVKRPRLSKLSEAKESEITNINSTANKTKQSNKSINSKNKSKTSSNSKSKQNIDVDLNSVSKSKEDFIASKNNESLNNSNSVRVTRNKSKSMKENSFRDSKDGNNSKQWNKSKNTLQSKQNISVKAVHEIDKGTKQMEEIIETNLVQNEGENEPMEQAPDDDDEDFTLEYENDDEQINELTITENINKRGNSSQPSNKNNDINNKSLKDLNIEITSVVDSDTGKFKVANEEIHKKQKNSNEPNDTTKHNETDLQHNKQKPNRSLIKNSDKVKNSSLLEQKKLNESQNAKQQKQNSSTARNKSLRTENVNNVSQQNTQNKSKLEDHEKSTEEEEKYSNNENEEQNKSVKVSMDDVEEKRNESKHSSIHEQVSHKSAAEESKGAEENEENNQTHVDEQNESAKTEQEDENESEINEQHESEINEQHESVEIEQEDEANESESVEQNENVEIEQEDEANESESVEQNESVEIEQEDEANESEIVEQNESAEIEQEDEDESNESEIVEQNKSAEIDQEDEEEAGQNESENINSDDEENNENESNQDESEVQQSEEMVTEEEDDDVEEQKSEEVEADEEENQSEVDEQNESENQDESENAESEYEEQNESNISRNENGQENDLIESNQEQNDDGIEDNEVAEDQIISNESSNEHDTTGRHRKKNTNIKSPEAILHDKTNQLESFTAQGRNTSIRKTKSIIRNLNIRPSLAPVRESTGLSDGARDSSAEGSGWDSHRTTRKTIRLTLGKDFTPRKSLRALVMEKSAKRNTNYNDVIADTTKVPQANSTELPAFDSYQDTEPMHVDETVEEASAHEVSARTRQTTLETYLQKIKQENLERKRKMQEEIKASLKAPTRDTFNTLKIPLKPVRRMKPTQNKQKPKQVKSSVIPLDMLPPEVLEDMTYKPPKRFQPSNAAWITKRLYKFLETKLEPKYDYKARVRAERLVEQLYGFAREARRGPAGAAADALKREMARLDVVRTHFDFYQFFHDFMPREIRVKVVPDVVNKISLPKNGVFSDIIQ